MDNYIVINGKKAELTEDQLEKLGIKIKKDTPFARVKFGNNYYITNQECNVIKVVEAVGLFDEAHYNSVNYFNDKGFAKQVTLHQLLYRKLLKYAYENDAADCDWTNGDSEKYFIIWQSDRNKWLVDCACSWKNSSVYFNNRHLAEAAIADVIEPFMREHPDFEW